MRKQSRPRRPRTDIIKDLTKVTITILTTNTMDETMSLALSVGLRPSAVTMDKSCPNMAYRQTDARSTDDLQHNQTKRNHLFPLDAIQITPNGVFIVHRMQFLPRLVALLQRRWYWSWLLKNVYQSLLMDWRCVLCLKEYCSLLILQLIVS